MGYKGYPWTHWNVNLWINNDKGLYSLAVDCVKTARNLTSATSAFLDALDAANITQTPDGAKYTKTAVKHALSMLRD